MTTQDQTQDQAAELTAEQTAAAQAIEQQQVLAQAQANFIAKYPLTIASMFEPGKAFTVSISSRSVQGADGVIAKVSYEDIAVAVHDLNSVLNHAREALQAVVQSNSYAAGRADAMNAIAAEQAAAAAAATPAVEDAKEGDGAELLDGLTAETQTAE